MVGLAAEAGAPEAAVVADAIQPLQHERVDGHALIDGRQLAVGDHFGQSRRFVVHGP